MLAPRILGVAAKAWSEENAIDADMLAAHAGEFGKLFKAMNWQTSL